MPDPIAARYDAVPYTANTHVATHPCRIAGIARLHGVDVVDPYEARVLDVGCGRAANLLAMAMWMPDARCSTVSYSLASPCTRPSA